MSHAAIAAVLAREDLSAGERLVAFSLASFADREQLAFAGTPAAAARAGLGKSRYLQARDRLVGRGLVNLEGQPGGRGRSRTVKLVFARSGPWWDGDINAQLLEAVLGYSRARGPARLLLAAMAAIADADGLIDGVCTEELRAAAGLADSSYRRARAALLASGEVVLAKNGGGRGNTNRWQVLQPRELGLQPTRAAVRRTAPAPRARPLVAPLSSTDTARAASDASHAADSPPVDETADQPQRTHAAAVKRPALNGVSGSTGPVLSGVSVANGPVLSGVSVGKGPVLNGVSGANPAKTPPETPPQTPPPYVRAGSNAVNPRTSEHPPSPPGGGRSETSITIEETFTSGRGRRRSRQVNVDLDEVRRALGVPGASELADWERIRELLAEAVSEDTFAVWFEPVTVIAIDRDGALVVDAPPELKSWLSGRFARVIEHAAERVGRATRIADLAQSAAMGAS